MYKKLHLSTFLLALLLAIVGTGAAWADTEPFYTLDTSLESSKGKNSSYDSGGTITINEIEWYAAGNMQTTPWRLGGKGGSINTATQDVERALYTQTAMTSEVSSVSLEIGTVSVNTFTSVKLTVSDKSDFTSVLDEVTISSPEANSTLDFKPTSGTTWGKDAYYKFTFSLNLKGKSNTFVQPKTVKYFAPDMSSAAPISFTNASETTAVGDGYKGQKLTNDEGLSVTWASSNEEVATVGTDGTVSVLAAGKTTISATFDGDDTYSKTTVSYTLEVKAKYTVTYFIRGKEYTASVLDGETWEPEEPASNGMPFAGWSKTNDVTAPSFVTLPLTVTTDQTLYAVFVAKQGDAAYKLVEANQTDWSGKYLIAYSDEVFANGKTGGKSGIGSADSKQKPGENLSTDKKEVNLSWGDQYYVEIESYSDKYLLKTQDGQYNYQTSNANGIATTTTKATAASYAFSVEFTSSTDIKLKLSGNAEGAVFRYNENDAIFRFYKNGTQSPVYLYKRVEDVTYTLALPVAVSITTAGYATFCSEQALDFTDVEDIYAYKASVEGDAITFTRVKEVPAGAGVLLRSLNEGAGEASVPVLKSAEALEGNLFVGTLTDISSLATTDGSTGATNYILNNHSTYGIGFYRAAGKGLGAGKAYLQVPAEVSTTRSFIGFDFNDTTTGIGTTEALATGSSAAYDLQGRRVSAPRHGLYIVGGKKVLVK